MLQLFNSNQSALKVFHNLEEIFEREGVGLYFHLLDKLDCFIRFTTNFSQDSFNGFQVDISSFILVEYIKDCSEIFNFLLGVDFKNVQFTIYKQLVKALLLLTSILLLLFALVLFIFLFFLIVGQVYSCDIYISRLIHRFRDLWALLHRGLLLFLLLFFLIVQHFLFIASSFFILLISRRGFFKFILSSFFFLVTFVLFESKCLTRLLLLSVMVFFNFVILFFVGFVFVVVHI